MGLALGRCSLLDRINFSRRGRPVGLVVVVREWCRCWACGPTEGAAELAVVVL